MNFNLTFLQNSPDWIPNEYWKYLNNYPVFIIALLATLILTPIVGYIAKRYNILNVTKNNKRFSLNKYDNDDRRINPDPTPLLGGLAIIIPLIIFLIFAFGFNQTTTPIIIALIIIVIGGVLDDIYNLPATTQFFLQFIAATIIALSVINLDFIKLPFDGIINLNISSLSTNSFIFPIEFLFPGDLIMIFWILIVINALKWVGGLDALLEGTISISFLLLLIIGIRTSHVFVILTSVYMLGAFSGFIFYNFPPAKIFSASAGKTSYGFLVAILSLMNETKGAITIMIILLPLVDFVFVLLKRISISKPRNFVEFIKLPLNIMRMSDTNHLHHQLLKIGFSPRKVLLVEMSISLFIGIIAVSSTEAFRFVIILSFGLLIMIFLLLLHILSGIKEKQKQQKMNEESPESKYSY